MYVGPWQEYKLMRIIREVKAENSNLRAQLGESVPSGAGSDVGSARSTVTPMSTSARYPDRRRNGGGVTGGGGSSYAPSDAGSVRSAPADFGHGTHDLGNHSSMLQHPLASSLVRGPPKSHELEEKANVRPLQRSSSQRGMGGGSVKGRAGAGLDPQPSGVTFEDEKAERIKRRAMLSMLYAGDGRMPDEGETTTEGGVRTGPTEADMVAALQAHDQLLEERKAILAQQAQKGQGGGMQRSGGAQPKQRRDEDRVTRQRVPSASRQRPGSAQRRPQHGEATANRGQPSKAVVGLVNRNVIRDLRHHHGNAANEDAQEKLTSSKDVPLVPQSGGAVDAQPMATGMVPWDTMMGFQQQPARHVAPASTNQMPVSSSSALPPNHQQHHPISPTIAAYLDEQKQLVAKQPPHGQTIYNGKESTGPRPVSQGQSNGNGPLVGPAQHVSHYPVDTQALVEPIRQRASDVAAQYRRQRPYDYSQPVRPVVGETPIDMAELQRLDEARQQHAIAQQQQQQLQIMQMQQVAGATTHPSPMKPPAQLNGALDAGSLAQPAAGINPVLQAEVALRSPQREAKSNGSAAVGAGSGRPPRGASPPRLSPDLLSVEAMRQHGTYVGAVGNSPAALHQQAPAGFALPGATPSPVRAMRTEPRSGTGAISPGGTGRPLSSQTDASISDLNVGGLLQWTAQLDQRDSWGRLPSDANYGVGF